MLLFSSIKCSVVITQGACMSAEFSSINFHKVSFSNSVVTLFKELEKQFNLSLNVAQKLILARNSLPRFLGC